MNDIVIYDESRRVTRALRRNLDIAEADDLEQALIESVLTASSAPLSGSSTSATDATVTIDPVHLLPSPISALPTSLPASVPAARGFIYAAGQSVSRTAMFRFNSGVYLPFGDRMIPDVRVGQLFRVPPNTETHRSFVVLAGRCFLCYGFNVPTFPRNELIWALKHTTVWRGDVVVFQVGLRNKNPLLRTATVRRLVIDTVVSIFVSRVTEALDLKLQVPSIIEA